MPSLKMKTKSSTCCLKERNSLRIQSSIISKKESSHVRISENTADPHLCVRHFPEVSTSTQVSANDIESDGEIYQLELLDENFSHFLTESSDFPTMGVKESGHGLSSNLETIFSPALQSIEVFSEPNADNDTVRSDVHTDISWVGADDSDSSKGSCCYQTCDVSDFYISDMIVTSIPFIGIDDLYDTSENNFFPSYRCAEPNMLFDVAEQYMLPLLVDPIKSSNASDDIPSEEAMLISNESGVCFAIDRTRPCNQELVNYSDSDQTDCFDPQFFIKNVPELSDVVSNFHPNPLPAEASKGKSTTLALDLDETLVHSTLEHCDHADFTFNVFFNMKEHTVYVKKRPHLRTFLKQVAEMFEVVVFTASQSIYAEQLLDVLDPDGKLISRRVYRESCLFSEGSCTKDLTVLGVNLEKVAIIDNSPQVFRLQVNNGIPIKSWFDDPSDCALLSLLPFLETLVGVHDVRPLIAKRFSNKE